MVVRYGIQFCNSLESASDSSLHETVLTDKIHDAYRYNVPNSASSVSCCPQSIDYHFPLSSTISLIDVNTVMNGLGHTNSLSWTNLLYHPRTSPTTNATLCTYYNWFRPFNQSNPYFRFPVSGERMKCFLLLTMSSQSLPIETGRHDRPAIPHSTRLCPH